MAKNKRRHVARGIHDKGIERRIKQIWAEEGYHLLAVIPNVNYKDKARVPLIEGELDILKLYSFGKIGIEEVKCSENSYVKAQEQLKRAKGVFRAYNPSLATYIVNRDYVIPYRELK